MTPKQVTNAIVPQLSKCLKFEVVRGGGGGGLN